MKTLLRALALLLLCSTGQKCLAQAYPYFAPGGALSCTSPCEAQSVNLAATGFILSQLVVASGGTGDATMPIHAFLIGNATAALNTIGPFAVDTLVQGQGASADPSSVAVPNCGSSSQALSYSTSTHTFGCQSITAGSAALTATDVGYGSASNILTGTSDFTWVDSTHTLTMGGTAGATTIATGPQNGGSSGGLSIVVGVNTFFATGGPLNLQGSNATGAGVGGGNVNIIAGTSASSTAGSATIQTGGSTRITVGPTGNATFTNAIISGGTKFTASGCSNTTTVGGATAGSFHSGTSGTCTVTITLPSSTNGWSCTAADITTPADVINQSGSATNSCTVSGTTVSGDVIVFSALGF
jgi:hypothetical protein